MCGWCNSAFIPLGCLVPVQRSSTEHAFPVLFGWAHRIAGAYDVLWGWKFSIPVCPLGSFSALFRGSWLDSWSFDPRSCWAFMDSTSQRPCIGYNIWCIRRSGVKSEGISSSHWKIERAREHQCPQDLSSWAHRGQGIKWEGLSLNTINVSFPFRG